MTDLIGEEQDHKRTEWRINVNERNKEQFGKLKLGDWGTMSKNQGNI
jgi:hypothetical protein